MLQFHNMNITKDGEQLGVFWGNNSSAISNNNSIHEPRYALLVLLLLICCSALGNLLVCIAVIWDRRLQNMTNYFLMSLAIADLLVSLLVMPLGMVVEIYGYFPLGKELCVFWVTMDVLMCTASIWHMCTMSMDRYFTLKHPMRYGRNKTKLMVALKICFVWVVSITISSPPLIFGIKDSKYVLNGGICAPVLADFVIYGSIFAFYIPLTIMLVTYVLTIRILWKNQLMMKSIERSRPRKSKCQIKTMLSPPSDDASRMASLGNGSETDATTLAAMLAQDDRFNQNVPEQKLTASMSAYQMTNSDKQKAYEALSKSASGVCLHRSTKSEGNTSLAPTQNKEKRDSVHEDSLQLSKGHTLSTSYLLQKDDYSNVQDTDTQENEESEIEIPIKGGYRLNLQMLQKSPPKNFLQVKSCSFQEYRSKKCSSLSSSPLSHSRSLLQVNNTLYGGGQSHSCNDVNRDIKLAEWKNTYSQIQSEMDQCIQDAKEDEVSPSKDSSSSHEKPNKTYDKNNGMETHEHNLNVNSSSVSGLYESEDNEDTSSSNSSELLTINLQPQSFHMYKLNSNDVSTPLLQKEKKEQLSNGHLNHVGNGLHLKSTMNMSIPGGLAPGTIDRQKVSNKSIKNLLRRFHKTEGLRQHLSKKATSNEKKASKVLGIIFAVFVILWTPFFILNIMTVTCKSCMTNISPDLTSIFLWMGYVASLANPIIYTMFNTAFRRTFIRILQFQLCRKGGLTQDSVTGISYPMVSNTNPNDRRNTVTVVIKEHANMDNGKVNM